LQRDKVLDDGQAAASLDTLSAWWRHWNEVSPASAVRERAIELAGRHSLKAADALQLAAAGMVLQQNDPACLFVCLDQQLAAAARSEGLRVL